ncbi:MAG: Undecaprenyl phosphate-alpha-4-amino-4-deoxy-L-arabinose arabinosyl transferase [Verrucomicrobiota bacterium]
MNASFSTSSSRSSEPHNPFPASRLLLLFLALCGFFSLGNDRLPLIDRDEPRFAEASREMMQSGDWIVPTFNHAPRYDKPPLIYWMQVACYKTLGDNEFASRLPAAFCTALTAILLLLWGTRLADPRTGLRAALMYTLCLQVFVHGRAAVADPPMVLCVLAAAWTGWEWIQNPNRRVLGAAFWILLALGFLAKGPVAWIPIGMTGWAALQRRKSAQPVPSATAWLLGCAGMVGLVCLWGIPALRQTGGQFAAKGLGEHVVGRSLIAMEGHGAAGILGYLATLPFYFLTLFLSFAPWSFCLPAAFRSRKRIASPVAAFLTSGVVLTFAIFTLSRTKLPHYTLPAFPFLCLLLSLWWRKAMPAKRFRKIAWTTGILFAALPLIVFPLIPSLSVSESAVAAARPLLHQSTPVALVDYQEPSLIWGLRKAVRGFVEILSEADVERWMAQPGERLCILTTPAAQKIQGPWIRTPVEGFNFAKGRRVSLTLLKTAPAPKAP